MPFSPSWGLFHVTVASLTQVNRSRRESFVRGASVFLRRDWLTVSYGLFCFSITSLALISPFPASLQYKGNALTPSDDTASSPTNRTSQRQHIITSSPTVRSAQENPPTHQLRTKQDVPLSGSYLPPLRANLLPSVLSLQPLQPSGRSYQRDAVGYHRRARELLASSDTSSQPAPCARC
jgi:hypothetical protein